MTVCLQLYICFSTYDWWNCPVHHVSSTPCSWFHAFSKCWDYDITNLSLGFTSWCTNPFTGHSFVKAMLNARICAPGPVKGLIKCWTAVTANLHSFVWFLSPLCGSTSSLNIYTVPTCWFTIVCRSVKKLHSFSVIV